jgi:selenocysteine lyase/cysteine desulfurase
MWVGGEFYYDDRWQLESPVIDTGGMTFLNGGKACLIVVADYLRSRGIDQILLPAYLCPTILDTLESCGMRYSYYPVRPDLAIDLDALDRVLAAYKAVLFINYFGFQHDDETRAYFAALRRRGVFVVEDNAQAGFPTERTGDFVFNSLRKLAPYDGGYLLTPYEISDLTHDPQGQVNRRLPLIREYRRKLGEYRYRGAGSHEHLARLYAQAERYYAQDFVVAGDAQERQQIERTDWAGINRARRQNYTYMLELISRIPGVTPLFPALQADNLPLGLPVYIDGVPRDRLFDALGYAGIGLTVHWDALLRDPRLNTDPVAVSMASRMLTLVVDQRHTRKQLEYQAERLSGFMLHPE